uniref:Thioredoxin domain-containing protein n=1 Tax=Ananas comosus var. bracteatus TaxID=296719 RepID=A0A6V7QKB2_ANACO|nr:unnamed protein product [Ananas comosus var. bracteatus]
MSHTGASMTNGHVGADALSDRFDGAVAFDANKPDAKEIFALASAATTSSSSTGSSAGLAGRRTHSGEFLFGSSREAAHNSAGAVASKPGHRRTGSVPIIPTAASTTSTATSPVTHALPAGNICPSGKIAKPGAAPLRPAARSDVLGSGTANYGHGSIMRGGGGGSTNGTASAKAAAVSMDNAEEVKRVGNEHYKKGRFEEALRLYERAIAMCPDNAACRSNRAAALIGLGRLGEAVRECEEAVRLDPAYGRAHHRLAALLIRLGQVDNARRHLFLASPQPDPVELQKLQAVEKHLSRCAEARKSGDWKSALGESDAAIAAGADSSPSLIALRAEALLRLHHLSEAELAVSNASKLVDCSSSCCSVARAFGFLSLSYIFFVRAQVEMALGRFENAVGAAEKSKQADPGNVEVTTMLNKHDPLNSVLYCNRAACRYKLRQWEKSIDDCNEALRIQPNYIKALLRRAASNGKIERWAECVRDYEVLSKELPGDIEVAEALFHAQVALKTSRGEEVSNLKFGGEVEEITGIEQFQTAITLPGVSVVHFMASLNEHCSKISPFVDALCTRYPSVNFLKVDISESPAVAKAENVRTIPTFKIYKNGARVKEMICPSQQVLEYSVRHYVF